MIIDEPMTVRRILVAYDASPHGAAALQAAVNMAAELHAELEGLFVEDVNLLRAAGLPFIREIGVGSGSQRPLDAITVQRALEAQAERLRKALAERAHRSSVDWSFRVLRGHVMRETWQAGAGADLLVLGRESLVFSAGAAPRSMGQRPIVAVFDHSPAAWRALQTAARLAHVQRDELVLFLAGAQPGQAVQLRQQCDNALQSLAARGGD
jgi:nucleotide-binding universal stress UspA family protein